MARLSAKDADREAGVDPYPSQIRYNLLRDEILSKSSRIIER